MLSVTDRCVRSPASPAASQGRSAGHRRHRPDRPRHGRIAECRRTAGPNHFGKEYASTRCRRPDRRRTRTGVAELCRRFERIRNRPAVARRGAASREPSPPSTTDCPRPAVTRAGVGGARDLQRKLRRAAGDARRESFSAMRIRARPTGNTPPRPDRVANGKWCCRGSGHRSSGVVARAGRRRVRDQVAVLAGRGRDRAVHRDGCLRSGPAARSRALTEPVRRSRSTRRGRRCRGGRAETEQGRPPRSRPRCGTCCRDRSS